MISSTRNENVAKTFANDEIVIEFWDYKYPSFFTNVEKLPMFKNVPYKSQAETTVFGAILPHYIYSFTYKGDLYINPALFCNIDPNILIRGGLIIDQTNFNIKLKQKTSYSIGVINNNNSYSKII